MKEFQRKIINREISFVIDLLEQLKECNTYENYKLNARLIKAQMYELEDVIKDIEEYE